MNELDKLATADRPTFRLPVRIVAGGTDPSVQAQIGEYSHLLMEGLAGFDGTIISGGTTEGICGLVGDAAQRYGDRIHTVGYIPGAGFGEAADATVDKDPERYRELCYTDGRGFTPLEALQNWIDLVVSRVPVKEVRVVGINGGRIAGAEYRIALALGAVVGVISESGREAGRILTDEQWSSLERLITLPRDAQTVRAFFGSLPRPFTRSSWPPRQPASRRPVEPLRLGMSSMKTSRNRIELKLGTSRRNSATSAAPWSVRGRPAKL
jgi:hypothetical protein